MAAAASASSPNVVKVLGGGTDPSPHVVMEYIEGTDLSAELENGALALTACHGRARRRDSARGATAERHHPSRHQTQQRHAGPEPPLVTEDYYPIPISNRPTR